MYIHKYGITDDKKINPLDDRVDLVMTMTMTMTTLLLNINTGYK